MTYGYIRVSTAHQNTENGKFEIADYARRNGIVIDKWVIETISSRKKLSERKLGSLLKRLKRNDTIIATEISRIGRNMMEVMGILSMCMQKDCAVHTIKENYRLGLDIQSKVLSFAFSLSAEIERNLNSARTRETLARLKSEGKRLGRPYGSKNVSLKLAGKQAEIKRLIKAGTRKPQIAKQLGCSLSTLYKHIN
ncbi:master DNA invertase Mpi family serine-type recombinase [Deferribacterales bacterium RsTz2092]|nr:invertase [Deferribacterales bacterium]